jgi:glycosyltransferase involved in cell wall biosynthesis
MVSRAHISLNAHLLSSEASYRSAGIHGYLANTLAHLQEVDPNLFYTIFTRTETIPGMERADIRRSRLPTQNPLARIVWEQLAAPLQLARINPDLHHGMAFSLPILWRGTSVVTIFDLSFLRYPERLSLGRRLYLQQITHAAVAQARRVLAISESGKAEIATLLGVPEQQIDVALPGVGEHFRPLPIREVADFRIRNRLPERFILHLGTLEPRKNLETLLRAYAVLPQRPQVNLVMAGGIGWQTESIFSLIEALELKSDVILPGYIRGSDLPLWYNAAEILVYPSVYEGFGLPILEAMACGLPVIASNSSSLPEAVGDAGMLVPPSEVEAWTQTISKMLDGSEDLASYKGLGQNQASQFTWESTAHKVVSSYHKAMEHE